MTIEELRNTIPDYAKDIKINLGTVLTEAGAPGLTQQQIYFILLTSAYSTRNVEVIIAAQHETHHYLSPEEMSAAKTAATIMAMNNVYYRFSFAMNDAHYASLPANLRMNGMRSAGTDKLNFELGSLAASIINGCTKCMNAHAEHLEHAGMSREGIQSTARIASVIEATALVREIM